jgi:hypothetical protein
VTYNHAQPARSDGGSGGAAPGVKTFASAVLLTYGAGMLLMVGYALLNSFFGVILGIAAAGFGIVFWKNRHGGIFPSTIPTRSVIILAVVNILLGVILVLTAG